jgi:hypothetical protein
MHPFRRKSTLPIDREVIPSPERSKLIKIGFPFLPFLLSSNLHNSSSFIQQIEEVS